MAKGDFDYQHEQVETELVGLVSRLKLEGLLCEGWFDLEWLVTSVKQELHAQKLELKDSGNLGYRIFSQWLWQNCQSDNLELQNAAYTWLGDYVYRHIFVKLDRQAILAEDITNDVLVKVFENIAGLRNPAVVITWVVKIAVQHVIRNRRKEGGWSRVYDMEGPDTGALEGKKDGYLYDVELNPEVVENTSSQPENLYLTREQIAELVARIEAIKPTKRGFFYKQIIYGTYFLSLTDRELAARLRLSVTDLQKMRHQALCVLRKKIINA